MLQPGDTIDIWVVESALGSGGMGSVYRCHNRAATRILAAIKVLDGGLTRYPEAEARFIREAEILFQLDHPNIVKVRNVRIDADPPYLEMEFVDGEPLDDRLRRGPIPFEEAVALMRQTAEALAYLHSKGIYHRDIKPANLLVQPDSRLPQSEFSPIDSGPRNLKLVDFGLAVEADGSRITQTGMAFGTVSYAPPEWIAPETLDPIKWDMYAFGVVLYEILTGTVAFPISGQGTARQQAMQVIIAKQGHPALDPGESFHDDMRQLVRDLTHPEASVRLANSNELVRRMVKLEPSIRRSAGVTLTPPNAEETSLPSLGPETESIDPSWGSEPTRPSVRKNDQRRAETWELPSSDQTPVGRAGMRRLVFVLSSFALFAFVVISVALLSAATVWWTLQPAYRNVVIELSGVDSPDNAPPIEIRIDEYPAVLAALHPSAPDAAKYSLQSEFKEVPLGPTIVQWIAGERCFGAERAPEPSPWCASGLLETEITSGSDTLTIPLAVELPKPRDVIIALPRLPSALPLRAQLVRKDAESEELGQALDGTRTLSGLAFQAVMPGPYTMSLAIGDCAEDDEPADGCERQRVNVVIPMYGAPSPDSLPFTGADIAIEPTEPSQNDPKVPAPNTTKRQTSHKGGLVVTREQIIEFVESNPEWKPNGHFGATSDKKRYIPWLSDTSKLAEAASGMTPALAEAFCKAQNMHVADLTDAPPLSKDMSGMELRRVEGDLKVIEAFEGEFRPLHAETWRPLTRVVVFRCVK